MFNGYFDVVPQLKVASKRKFSLIEKENEV